MSTDHNQQASLTASASWVLLGRVLSFVFTFALPLLLVRRLKQADFGLYKQVFLFVSTAIMLLPLGFPMSAFYFLPRERERQQQVVFNILIFHAIVAGGAGLLVIFWPGLFRVLFNSEEMVQLAPRIAVVVITWVIASMLEYVAIAHQEFKLSTIMTTASTLTRSSLLLLAAFWFSSVGALVNAAIIQGVLQVAIVLIYFNSRFPGFWRTFEWSRMRGQLSYALPFGFASVLLWAQSDMHNYFVAHHFGAAVYAIYAVGCFQIPLVIILNESVGFVMVSRVSQLQNAGSLERSWS
jgi:O-antigen/teichoic acid export membrane protein